jgi:signal peptidase I
MLAIWTRGRSMPDSALTVSPERPPAAANRHPGFKHSAGGNRALRAFLGCIILGVGLAVVGRVFLIDSYQVPTGSMAPTLLGHHRECNCPRCGYLVQVGLHQRDNGADEAPQRWYDRAFCPNCEAYGLALHQAPVVSGERLLVNKAAFAWRVPRRWEIVVFHLFGFDFIKRILGLPGESVEIKGGDLYVDGFLCRKTLDEFKAMRILVFDNNHQPQPNTWAGRWESAPYRPDAPLLEGTALHLDATGATDSWHMAAYRHFCLDSKQCLPIADEYAYNGAEPCRTVPVHDTMLECDVEFHQGVGKLALGITDGNDHLVVQIPVRDPGSKVPDAAWSLHGVASFSLPALEELGPPMAEGAGVSLRAAKRYHIELVFVDRRVMLAIDGHEVFEAMDLPACGFRAPLLRPVMLAVRGVKANFTNIRLWRDVHYTQDGKQGVGGAVVRLGSDQYFVLGDNSPRSEDSRFWPDAGAVPGSAIVGAPLLLVRPGQP